MRGRPSKALLKTFHWEGVHWTLGIFLGRLLWVSMAAAIVLIAASFFDRFDPARKGRKGRSPTGPPLVDIELKTASTSAQVRTEFHQLLCAIWLGVITHHADIKTCTIVEDFDLTSFGRLLAWMSRETTVRWSFGAAELFCDAGILTAVAQRIGIKKNERGTIPRQPKLLSFG